MTQFQEEWKLFGKGSNGEIDEWGQSSSIIPKYGTVRLVGDVDLIH